MLIGRGYFEASNLLRVETAEGQQFVQFEQAIIAVGSKPALPKAFDLGNPRIMTSTEASQVEEVPTVLQVRGRRLHQHGTWHRLCQTSATQVVILETLESILIGRGS